MLFRSKCGQAMKNLPLCASWKERALDLDEVLRWPLAEAVVQEVDCHEDGVIKIHALEKIGANDSHGNLCSTLDGDKCDIRLRDAIDDSGLPALQLVQVHGDLLLKVHLLGWLVAPCDFVPIPEPVFRMTGQEILDRFAVPDNFEETTSLSSRSNLHLVWG